MLFIVPELSLRGLPLALQKRCLFKSYLIKSVLVESRVCSVPPVISFREQELTRYNGANGQNSTFAGRR